MSASSLNSDMRTGTAGGTLLALLSLGEEMTQTVILAATGAVTSFLISWVLRYLFSRGEHRKRSPRKAGRREGPDPARYN